MHDMDFLCYILTIKELIYESIIDGILQYYKCTCTSFLKQYGLWTGLDYDIQNKVNYSKALYDF